jgi:hypothetical protein
MLALVWKAGSINLFLFLKFGVIFSRNKISKQALNAFRFEVVLNSGFYLFRVERLSNIVGRTSLQAFYLLR